MINVKIDIKEYNTDSAALEIEHISQLIMQGYTSGIGWSLDGQEQKEDGIVQVEEEEELEEEIVN